MEGFYHVGRGTNEEQDYGIGPPSERVEEILGETSESRGTTFRKGTDPNVEEACPVREWGSKSVGPPLALFEGQGPGSDS